MRAMLMLVTLMAGACCALPAFAQPAALATPAAAGAIPEGKLDGTVVPVAYRLDLSVDPDRERFSGHVEIDATLKKTGRYVWMHGRGLAVASVTAKASGKVLTGSFAQTDATGVALLTFTEALPAGPVTLAFDYDARFNDNPAGLFRVKVGAHWYSWSQFESTDARAAFPSFDEPGFKTPWLITLRTPAGLTAISNAPETATETRDGITVHTFAPTLPLPSYLVALMVGPFVTAEGTIPPTPQRSFPLPIRVVSTQQNAASLKFALEGTKGIVTLLENYFGQSFPYPKLDQITSPIMPGAMENAGADLYEDSLLVLDDKASTEQKRNFGMVVSHELAHQWFGDLVTPAWWDDTWLNESFANWMGYRIGNEWRPDLNIGAGALAEGFGAMGTDALLAGRPIHQPITKTSQIDAAFDSITYGKGGQVVAMIAAFMGDRQFRDGVRGYMAAHKYGNATTADFFKAMADGAGDPRILPAMQSFTDQQGVPLVTFARAGSGTGQWTVTQSRYARLGTEAPPTRWGIPLCVRQGQTRVCQLLTQVSTPLTVSGQGALLPNAGGTGYYRFELPAKDWDALIAATPKLPGGEALAVSDSLSASFVAGRASPAQIIAGTRALAANPDSYANGDAIDLLRSMVRRGVVGAAALPKFEALVAQLYAPRLKALGFDPRAAAHGVDDAERQQNRRQLVGLLASVAKDKALCTRLAAAAEAYLAGDTQALDPSYFGVAFNAWLASKKLAGAQQLVDRALASEDPLFRPTALAAVAASGDPATVQWLLNTPRDQRLRASEWQDLVRGVVAEPATRDWGFEWLKQNLDNLLAGNGGIFFAARLPMILNSFCSVAAADDIEALRPKFAASSGALELERAIERVRSCGKLKDARGAELTAALQRLK